MIEGLIVLVAVFLGGFFAGQATFISLLNVRFRFERWLGRWFEK